MFVVYDQVLGLFIMMIKSHTFVHHFPVMATCMIDPQMMDCSTHLHFVGGPVCVLQHMCTNTLHFVFFSQRCCKSSEQQPLEQSWVESVSKGCHKTQETLGLGFDLYELSALCFWFSSIITTCLWRGTGLVQLRVGPCNARFCEL